MAGEEAGPERRTNERENREESKREGGTKIDRRLSPQNKSSNLFRENKNEFVSLFFDDIFL